MEQTLLTLFPQERPVYPDTPPGGDNELVLSFSRGSQWCTARAVLRRGEDLRPPMPGGCRRTAGGGPSGIHPAHPPDPPAGLLPGRGGLPGDRAPLGDALRGPPGEAPHPGHGGRGLSPPGGGHAAGPIPGLPPAPAAGHGLRPGQPGGETGPEAPGDLPVCGHSLLSHPVRLLLLHLRLGVSQPADPRLPGCPAGGD